MEISLAYFQPWGRTQWPQIFGNYSITPSITAKAIIQWLLRPSLLISNVICDHVGYVRWSLAHPLDIHRERAQFCAIFSIRGNIPAVAKPDKSLKKSAQEGSFFAWTMHISATMRISSLFSQPARSHVISAVFIRLSIFGDVTYILHRDSRCVRTHARTVFLAIRHAYVHNTRPVAI